MMSQSIRRLLLVVAAALAPFAIFVATGAAATTYTAHVVANFDTSGVAFTDTIDTTSYPMGGSTWTCTGERTDTGAAAQDVETCTITGDTTGFIPGTYSGAPDGDLPPLGTISWVSDYDGADALDWTITISANVPAAEVRPPNTVFLCNSKFQGDPGAWRFDTAKGLFAAGYWQPFAVKGTVAGGTNIGGYHLICNTALKPTGRFLGGSGEVVGPEYATGNLGYAVIVG